MTDQLSISFAKAARDEGMQRAADHANRAIPGWGDLALQFLRLYALRHAEFTSEQVRHAADDWGLIAPPTAKAWGQVYRRAAREGVIEKAGYAVALERHYSPCPLW